MVSNSDSEHEWKAIELLYNNDANRMTRQLEFCLIIRGWAVTIFAAIISAVIVYSNPLLAIGGIIPLAIFYYSECRYDAYRIIFQKRLHDIEILFIQGKLLDLSKTKTPKVDNRLDGIPLSVPEELSSDFKVANKLAAKQPVRLITYMVLSIALVIAGLTLI